MSVRPVRRVYHMAVPFPQDAFVRGAGRIRTRCGRQVFPEDIAHKCPMDGAWCAACSEALTKAEITKAEIGHDFVVDVCDRDGCYANRGGSSALLPCPASLDEVEEAESADLPPRPELRYEAEIVRLTTALETERQEHDRRLRRIADLGGVCLLCETAHHTTAEHEVAAEDPVRLAELQRRLPRSPRRAVPRKTKATRGECWYCAGFYPLRKDGTLRLHRTLQGHDVSLREIMCEGSGRPPGSRVKDRFNTPNGG
jgi:hypothetical protein